MNSTASEARSLGAMNLGERKLAEEALSSEARLRSVVENVGEGYSSRTDAT